MPHSDTHNPTRRTLAGFTLIELFVLVAVMGILLSVSVPMYLRAQRVQRLRTAAQGIEGAVTALRNLAITSRYVGDPDDDAPSGYCLGMKTTGPEFFSYVETGSEADPHFTPDEDAPTMHILSNDNILTAPDLAGAYRSVDVADVLVNGTSAVDEDAPLYVAPFLCFAPPKGDVKMHAVDGTSITPAVLAYEFTTNGTDIRVRIEVDSSTGKISTSELRSGS